MATGERKTRAFTDEAEVLHRAAAWWHAHYAAGSAPPWAGDLIPMLDAAAPRDQQTERLAGDIRRVRDEQWQDIMAELEVALAGTDVGRDVAAARRRDFLSPSLAIKALTSVRTTIERAALLKHVEQWVASWQSSPIDGPDHLWVDVPAASLGVGPGPGGIITYGSTLRGLEHRPARQREGHDGTALRYKLIDVRSMQYTGLARRFMEVLEDPAHREAFRVWATIGPSERGASGMILVLTTLCTPRSAALVEALTAWWRFWYVD